MMDPSRVRVTGPLEQYAPGFVAELVGVGYRPVSAAFQLQLMAHLSRWLAGEGLEVRELDLEVAERFLAARRAGGLHELSVAQGAGAVAAVFAGARRRAVAGAAGVVGGRGVA